MSDTPRAIHRSNPFSTRYTRPGAIPFIFPPDVTLQTLIDRLAANDWRGAIVGPHGSGKSTLLRSLIMPELDRIGRSGQLITLHDGQRSLPPRWREKHEPPPGATIVVDGYEQLSRWSRVSLRRLCRRQQWGLLVTCHQPVDLPVIFETRPTAELMLAVVDRLAPTGVTTLTQFDILDAYQAAAGNIREALFDLYDRHDRPPQANQPAAHPVK